MDGRQIGPFDSTIVARMADKLVKWYMIGTNRQ